MEKNKVRQKLKEFADLNMTGMYIGIDGCRGGWITAVYDGKQICIEKFASISAILSKYHTFDEMLIDMSIGLPSTPADVRPDAAARKIVSPRTSTIFAVPSRQAVYEVTEKLQMEANKRALGKGLSKQTMAIIPKIRELDQYLVQHREYANVIKESHPEVCFARLNGAVVMSKKSKADGLSERIDILNKHLSNLDKQFIVDTAHTLKCNADDIVDAIVLAVTGCLNAQNKCEVIPKHVQKDEKNLKMQMIVPLI